ncbi:MAG: hypothetical protein EXQ52_05175 [Bryobacterales bacterium]|nr:hypothetical protein [Bryobacterales bacterium]
MLRWLAGRDEAAGFQAEPYQWVLGNAERGAKKVDLHRQLSITIREILDGEPELNLEKSRRDRVLYNLLSLCGALARPLELDPPLTRMYRREKLSTQYEGIDLRDRLRAAMIANQTDNSKLELWRRMGRGTENYLPGDPVDAFFGVLLLPPVKNMPLVEELGPAFNWTAKFMESDFDRRRPRFMGLVNSLKQMFPEGPRSWDHDLIDMADKDSWPGWTLNCFDVVPFEERSRGKVEAYVPRPLALGIRDGFGVRLGRKLWEERIYEMTLNNGALKFFDSFKESFEKDWGRLPFQSDSARGVVFRATMRYSLKPNSASAKTAQRTACAEYRSEE